jgi:hypothetical protein
MKHFPSPRCASATKIVRLRESTAETQPPTAVEHSIRSFRRLSGARAGLFDDALQRFAVEFGKQERRETNFRRLIVRRLHRHNLSKHKLKPPAMAPNSDDIPDSGFGSAAQRGLSTSPPASESVTAAGEKSRSFRTLILIGCPRVPTRSPVPHR